MQRRAFLASTLSISAISLLDGAAIATNYASPFSPDFPPELVQKLEQETNIPVIGGEKEGNQFIAELSFQKNRFKLYSKDKKNWFSTPLT